jgi:RNA polymerase sigma factor (sigma-70 family)
VATDRIKVRLGLLQTLRAPDARRAGDGQLLEQFVERRDEAAFAELVRRHGPMVLGVCRRVLGNHADADDAFQAAFLVLVRKAGSLVTRPVLGDWLHGVARRTAQNARLAAARRRAKEQAAARAEAAPEPRNDWLPLLDEALGRLPEKYRLPVVLCDLEGRTRREAAGMLGWPEGTVAGRLARGRALLAKRLLRGAQLLSGVVPGAAAANAAQAAVPAGLAAATVQAAALIAVGEATASGALTAEALTLAQGVMRTMLWNKLKLGMLVVLVVVVTLAGAGGLTFRALAGHANPKPSDARTAAIDDEPRIPPAAEAAPGVPLAKARPVKGLKLTLAADLTETVMQADGRNAKPVPLQLTFANVGEGALKLDAYDLPWRNIALEVTGPDAQSVRFTHPPIDRISRTPAAADFPTIKAGGDWPLGRVLQFPGALGEGSYALLKPGEYRVKLVYATDGELPGEHAKGRWTGRVTSNEIVLKVLPAKRNQPPAERPGETKPAANPIDLVKAALARPDGGENYPALPSLSTEMSGRVCNEIAASDTVRQAYEKLDATRRNVDWFDGVAELEKQKAVWCLLSCLCHHHPDVQIHALRSLERLGDKRAVPFLLLYAEYMAVLVGGSENATIHGIIHQSAAKTLSALTGVRVAVTGQDPDGLKKGIKRWRKWLVEQDKDNSD